MPLSGLTTENGGRSPRLGEVGPVHEPHITLPPKPPTLNGPRVLRQTELHRVAHESLLAREIAESKRRHFVNRAIIWPHNHSPLTPGGVNDQSRRITAWLRLLTILFRPMA